MSAPRFRKNLTELSPHESHPGDSIFHRPATGAARIWPVFFRHGGCRMTHVPYNGIAPAVTAVVGGKRS
jgi:tripartite-type tricarboxylate transporter receptor subunit TctC